jgi:hypothetical protein
MVFTTSTLEILPYIRQHIRLFPFRLSKNAKTVLRNICKQIHTSAKHLPNLTTYTPIPDKIPNTFLYNEIPAPIRNQIETIDKKGRVYTFTVHERTIHVHLVFFKPSVAGSEYSRIYESEEHINTFFKSSIHRIAVWLQVAYPFAGKTCANELTCYLFLTEHTKILPKKDENIQIGGSHDMSSIDTLHANTAFTTACNPNSVIMLYRMEEWFKVFIHETFHSLGLDFSQMDNTESNREIVQMFPGCSRDLDVRLYETYCEMWAEILNVMFIAYYSESFSKKSRVFSRRISANTTKTRRNVGMSEYSRIISKTIAKTEEFLKYERAYTMYQASKVLQHSKITYMDLCNTTHKANTYTELTPVFSYYIVKSVLFYHINNFLEWCSRHNENALYFTKTQENIREYERLIGRLYKSDEFIQKINTILLNHKQNTPEKPDRWISQTLRMSLYETIPM